MRRKIGEFTEFTTEATLVSHDCAVFGCSYLLLHYGVVGICTDSKMI